MSWQNVVSSFDAFATTESSFTVKTRVGAFFSIIAFTIMAVLFCSELMIYMGVEVKPVLYVDTTIGDQLQINLDVIFHHLPCAFISVNAMDKTGNYQLNLHHDVFTTRLDQNGNPIESERENVGEDMNVPNTKLDSECGSCYGAESDKKKCCNTCEDVQEAYRIKGWAFSDVTQIAQCIKEGFAEKLEKQKDEGCRVHGKMLVERVGGNVNIVPGKFIIQNSRYVVDSNIYQFAGGFNISHTIVSLSFGEEYPGMKYPLNLVTKYWHESGSSPMYEYFLQIVPTVYEGSNGKVINSNQFSVTEYTEKLEKTDDGYLGRGVPGLFFMYELSPITIHYNEASKSFLHFVTNLCAIIGGIFAVFSVIDALVFRGINTLQKKIELGKHS